MRGAWHRAWHVARRARKGKMRPRISRMFYVIACVPDSALLCWRRRWTCVKCDELMCVAVRVSMEHPRDVSSVSRLCSAVEHLHGGDDELVLFMRGVLSVFVSDARPQAREVTGYTLYKHNRLECRPERERRSRPSGAVPTRRD